MSDDEGRGALIGEFMESFFAAPKDVQDQIIYHAVKSCYILHKSTLVDPFPVLSHLDGLIHSSSQRK